MTAQPSRPSRTLEELKTAARVGGVELDERYLAMAADAMDIWWDEVLAVRRLDLGGIADLAPIEPRIAPPVHARHPVPTALPVLRGASVAADTVALRTQPADLADATVSELLTLFANGAARPSEALAACLARIEAIDGVINSVMLVARDSAHTRARECDARWAAGTARPLEGIPFGLKDNIRTAGITSTGGSKVLAEHVPTESAHAVELLEAAGAVMVAKLASTEFASGGAQSPWYGAVHNPWDLDRFAGSSSSGPGGAVAARLLPFALGTDTLGSIRVPASCDGIVGWKPSYGAVSRRGVMPLSWTMDHVGPLARTVEDAARVLSIISAPDTLEESCHHAARPDLLHALGAAHDLSDMRIGFPRSYYEPLCDEPVIAAMDHVRDTLQACGAESVDVEIEHIGHAFGAGWLALLCEAASLHEDLWTRPDAYDPGLVFRLLVGKLAPATDYVRAMRFRTLLQNSFNQTFGTVDAVVLPGLVGSSPRYDDLRFDVNGTRHLLQKMHARFTAPGNVTGLPALCVPAGIGRDAMPVSFQIYSPAQRDDVCARIGHAFQLRTDHHQRVPTALARLLA